MDLQTREKQRFKSMLGQWKMTPSRSFSQEEATGTVVLPAKEGMLTTCHSCSPLPQHPPLSCSDWNCDLSSAKISADDRKVPALLWGHGYIFHNKIQLSARNTANFLWLFKQKVQQQIWFSLQPVSTLKWIWRLESKVWLLLYWHPNCSVCMHRFVSQNGKRRKEKTPTNLICWA